MKRALILSSVASMIDQFNMNNIKLLLSRGYRVDVITNFSNGGSISKERVKELQDKLQAMGVSCYDIPIPRKITNISGIISSFIKINRICKQKAYHLIHCHSPIGGVVARAAAYSSRKRGTKVLYTAHGFHFYKGAPLVNWLVFYPIEKLFSFWTDTLITINKEDYELAKTRLKPKRVQYIHGVGIDTEDSCHAHISKQAIREQLGLPSDSTILLSVGELNANKNHETVIRALGKIGRKDIHYYIAGQGTLKEALHQLARKLGMEENVHLLGYRKDVPALYHAADAFIFPSLREGLSVALMEAMAAGLPCIVSKIRGNVDLIDEGKGGYFCHPKDTNAFATSIQRLLSSREEAACFGAYNASLVRHFDIKLVQKEMEEIYFATTPV